MSRALGHRLSAQISNAVSGGKPRRAPLSQSCALQEAHLTLVERPLQTGCGRPSCRNEYALYATLRSFVVTTTR